VGVRSVLTPVPTGLVCLVLALRERLADESFLARHRVRPQDFTRRRKLPFLFIMLFILQKTAKSVQRHLHDFLEQLAAGAAVEGATPSAVTHARAKLRHTAFIEMSRDCVLPAIYENTACQPKLWRGHRLLGMDSSVVRLPNNPELRAAFTAVDVLCQFGPTGVGLAQARISVLYDLLNRAGLDARLEPSARGEVDLAMQQLPQARAGDLVISDRGFAGYRYLAAHQRLSLDFVVRCSEGSFAAARELFRADKALQSVIVTLQAPIADQARVKAEGLSIELTVRFVSLRLATGQLEVLATSLLSQELYPTEEFLQLYGRRWGHETFYLMLKSRLDLENFSGQTVEAIRQDFYASVLLCNLESILTQPAQEAMAGRSLDNKHQHPQQVNRANSYHALKNRLFELLESSRPPEETLRELQKLFMETPVTVRKRPRQRNKASQDRSYHYQKRVKKMVF
jgi:hypothetical protein